MKKSIFSINFWKIFFFGSVIWSIYYFYIIPIPADFAVEGVSHFSLALLLAILNAPLAVAMFKRKKV